MSEVDTSTNFPRWHQMGIMEPDWFEFKSGSIVLQIYSNWDEDAWILLDASQNPDAEPSQHVTLYQHGSLTEVQAYGLSWACNTLCAQLTQERSDALEEAAGVCEDVRDELVEALEFYANEENWRMNGPLDVNSPRFDGESRARTILAKIKEQGHEC